MKKISGNFIISDDRGIHEGETMMCCHCGKHWVRQVGSGTDRGFCMKCMQVTCGTKECDDCVPFEARIDLTDAYNEHITNRLLSKYPDIKRL